MDRTTIQYRDTRRAAPGRGDYSNDLFLGRTDLSGTLDTSYGNAGVGYFTQDLGTASADSVDIGRAMAVKTDGTAVIVGNTTSNNVAVARYFDGNKIAVAASGEGRPMLALVAVRAASQPISPLSAGPVIGSDATADDLSPPDGAGDLTVRRRSARRNSIPASAPPASSGSLVSSPSM